MVNTRNAVSLVGQGTSETFQNPPSAQKIIKEVPETPSEGLALRLSNKPSTTDQLDDIDKDNSLYEATLSPSLTGTGTTDKDKLMPNAGPALAPALAPAPGPFVTLDKEITALTAEKKAAQKQQRLIRLREEKSRGFRLELDTGFDEFKQALALEQAKSVYDPNIYSGQSQCHFVTFFKQLALVFRAKPLIYCTHANKCVYAAGFLGSIPAQGWTAENERLAKDPAATLTYDLFKSFLQEQKLLALIRTADLVVRVSNVKQRSGQSVPDLIAYLNDLETQFHPPFDDLQRIHHLFVALYPHIRQTIIEQKRQWDTRKMLKKVATVIEAGKPPPKGICPRGIVEAFATLALERPSRLSRCTKQSKLAARPLVGYAKKRKGERCPAPTSNPAKPPWVSFGTVLGKFTNFTNTTVAKTAPALAPPRDHSK